MEHEMRNGNDFIEDAIDLPKQMLVMQIVMHTP
jgi:hypothetical protein